MVKIAFPPPTNYFTTDNDSVYRCPYLRCCTWTGRLDEAIDHLCSEHKMIITDHVIRPDIAQYVCVNPTITEKKRVHGMIFKCIFSMISHHVFLRITTFQREGKSFVMIDVSDISKVISRHDFMCSIKMQIDNAVYVNEEILRVPQKSGEPRNKYFMKIAHEGNIRDQLKMKITITPIASPSQSDSVGISEEAISPKDAFGWSDE